MSPRHLYNNPTAKNTPSPDTPTTEVLDIVMSKDEENCYELSRQLYRYAIPKLLACVILMHSKGKTYLTYSMIMETINNIHLDVQYLLGSNIIMALFLFNGVIYRMNLTVAAQIINNIDNNMSSKKCMKRYIGDLHNWFRQWMIDNSNVHQQRIHVGNVYNNVSLHCACFLKNIPTVVVS